MSFQREFQDPEAALLALGAAIAAFLVAGDLRVVPVALVGVLVVRVGTGILLHRPIRIPEGPMRGLTVGESSVARMIHLGYGDPAIAARLGISIGRTEARWKRILDKWRLSTRADIARHVGEILGEPPEHPAPELNQRWEVIAEVGMGVAVMALGLGALAIPPDTPVVGDWRNWIGLSLLAAGLVFTVVSIATYVYERGRHGRMK